jgi:hypothetical protein
MPDRQLQDGLAQLIINILMNTLPVPYQLKDLTYIVYKLVRTQLLRDEDSFRNAMSGIGNSIAKDIIESVSQHATAPGNARSAVHDLQACVEASDLSLDKLFQLNLNKKELSEYIWNNYPKHLKGGSLAFTERHNIVRMGIERLSEDLLSIAPNLPGFELLLAQNLIKTNKETLRLLNELKVAKEDSCIHDT